jgi:hypothetical protein
MKRKLDDIPVTTTLEEVLEKLRIAEPDDIELITGLFNKAKEIARPKALYKESFVEDVDGNHVRIDETVFESNVVAANLKDVHRVFAYVCTCGTEVDDWTSGEKDYVVSLWLDMIKEMFLHEASVYFKEYIKKAYGFENISAVNPGSGNVDNWDISQQRLLFDLVGDVKEEIGVELTDTFLMHPIKSTSGLLYPSDTEFVNCALCNRENCIGRRAEFDSALYAQAFH